MNKKQLMEQTYIETTNCKFFFEKPRGHAKAHCSQSNKCHLFGFFCSLYNSLLRSVWLLQCCIIILHLWSRNTYAHCLLPYLHPNGRASLKCSTLCEKLNSKDPEPQKIVHTCFSLFYTRWFGVKESENERLWIYYLHNCSIILTSKPACRCYNTQNSDWHQTLWNRCSKPNQVIVYQEPSYDASTFAETLKDGSWAIWKLLIFFKNTENLDSIYLWFYASTGMGIGRWPNNEVIDILLDPTTYQQTRKQKKPNFLKKEQMTTSSPLTTTSAAPRALKKQTGFT